MKHAFPSTPHAWRAGRRFRRGLTLAGVCLTFTLCGVYPAAAQEWIWHPNNGQEAKEGEVRYFRKTFSVPQNLRRANLVLSADNHFRAYLNGKEVARGDDWQDPARLNVTDQLKAGTVNLLAVEGRNDGGVAALIVQLELETEDGSKERVLTDKTWTTSDRPAAGWESTPNAPDGNWLAAHSLGRLGVDPWGNVFASSPNRNRRGNRAPTPAEDLATLPDFQVDLIHSASTDQGSWICMTVDTQGRLIVSPQDARQPLLRFRLSDQGQVSEVDTIDLGVGEAMGLLYAHDSLYANARGPQGPGLYRLQDTNNDDRLDQVKFLKSMEGGGEHGYHAIRLGPDGQLYVMNGNHTKVPEGIAPTSPHQHYGEDQLLPRDWDGNGHARGILAPGGYIARGSPDGSQWELVLAGFRNSYDFDFNADGEIFTFDSDMEWDWGMPWYRPTVVYHAVSAADFGWRSGTGKWPWDYPDTLPPAQIVGIGSPTGVLFGRGARFPAKYQQALYVMDWSYGRILAVHLDPDGASYQGAMESFVVGRPLNVTDMEIGHDGAMYFVTGGRGTPSGLYRVSYTGSASTAPQFNPNSKGAEARALRRKLEGFHGHTHPDALAQSWPHLGNPDRWIRHAARVAVESQPSDQWSQNALDEQMPEAALTALLALARVGPPTIQDKWWPAWTRLWQQDLSMRQKVQALRVAGLGLIRLERPDTDTRTKLTDLISPAYPSDHSRLNQELSRVLVYLEAPGVIESTLNLMENAATQEEQIHYLVALRTLDQGWTLDQRRRYFSWFNRDRADAHHPEALLTWFEDVDRRFSNGASYNKFLENFKKRAMETLTDEERSQLDPVLKGVETEPIRLTAPARSFVRAWSREDLEPILDQVSRGRSLEQGREALVAAQCLACHQFNGEGGAAGQELTAVGSRYTLDVILESILEPSKVVSEQYQNTVFTLKNGETVTGKIVAEENGQLRILTNALLNQHETVPAEDIVSRQPAALSAMPEGLLNSLTREEILDLLAYLQTGGNPDAPAYR